MARVESVDIVLSIQPLCFTARGPSILVGSTLVYIVQNERRSNVIAKVMCSTPIVH